MRRCFRSVAAASSMPLLSGCVVATSTSNDGDTTFLLLLGVMLIPIVIAIARSRRGLRRRRPSEERSERPSVAMLRAELAVLADDVIRLEPRVAICEAARDDFEAATHRYRVANTALDTHDDELDLVRVQRVVDEATWSMARARAILDGRQPPAPPTTLERPGRHGEPAIQLDEQDHPTYVGSPAEFRSGWFGVGGGLFGGLLLGGFGGWLASDEDSDADQVEGDDGFGTW